MRSPENFTLSVNGVETPSITEEFANGFIKRDYLPNLSATNYKFQTLKAVDDASTGSEGYVAVAPSSSYKFDIKGDNTNKLLVAKVLGAHGEDLSDTKVAVSLAKELRQQSPSTRFSGNTFTLENGFPKNGDTLNFRLGDQTYTATLNGVPDFEVAGSVVLIDGTKYDTSQAIKVLVDESKFTISGPESDRIRVGFSENSNGIFFNLSCLSKDQLEELYKYISYITDQEETLQELEDVKNKLNKTYFNNNTNPIKDNETDNVASHEAI